MPKRFSRLDFAIKTLRRVADFNDPTAADPTPPEGTVLKEYRDFKAGVNNPSYTRSAASLQGGYKEYSLQPFGYPAGKLTIVEVSERADGQIALFGGTTALNITNPPTDGSVKLAGFSPAKATLFVPSGTTQTNKVSQITGIRYKTVNGASYTLPFGQGASGDALYEFPRRTAIATAVKSQGANNTVSFTAEKITGF